MALDLPPPGLQDLSPLTTLCCFCEGGVPFEEAAQWAVPMKRGGKRSRGFYAHVECLAERLHPSFRMGQRSDADAPSPRKTWCCFCEGSVRRKEAVIALLPTESEEEAVYGFDAHFDCLAERLFAGFIWYWLGDPEQQPPVRPLETLANEVSG